MKKLISMALALVMCLSLMPCAFAAEAKFTDVPADAWYLDELEYAVANGYISGVGDNRFAPDGNITRGQFVTILGRMLDVSTSSGATKFVDVAESSYYAPYVAWAAANGIVNGTSSTTFAPDSNITFEQMGVILANYISKSGVVLSGYTASPAYKDAASISAYAVSSMEQMRQYGLISPDEAGNVNPQKAVSRAYGTVSLVRLAKALGLGEAPATATQTPVTSVSFDNILARFILDDPQLITKFDANDAAAWESNMRYMLKYGLTDVVLDVELNNQWDVLDNAFTSGDMDSFFDVLDSFFDDTFSDVAKKYHPLGVNFGTHETIDSVHLIYDSSLSESTVAFLNKAISVHDELWASGAIKSTMTQKEKARVYYDWLISHCAYDYETALTYGAAPSEFALSAHTAYGALIDGLAVCDGYAKAYNLFLMLEGISCGTESTPDHMWTSATLDGVLYHIDATWGDTSGIPNQYFCMTPEASWARFQ